MSIADYHQRRASHSATNLTFIGEVRQLRVPLSNNCIGGWNDSEAWTELCWWACDCGMYRDMESLRWSFAPK